MESLDLIKNYLHLLWEKHHTDTIFDVFSQDVKIHSPLRTVEGPEALKAVVETWLKAFPDLKVYWDAVLGEYNKVVAFWHAEGTHKELFLDVPASNKKISYQGSTLYELDNNKVIAYWAFVDIDNIKKQLTSNA